MTPSDNHIQVRLLRVQLRWLIRLRWLAGLTAILGSFIDAQWLHWCAPPWVGAYVGGAILLYNATLSQLHRAKVRPPVLVLAWVHILLDLACLTVLTLWTGGGTSPIAGFFVFHMVLASLLLPRVMAYACAAAAVAMLALGLTVTEQMPVGVRERVLFLGWGLTLLLTVYLTNHITVQFRRHVQRLVRGQRHIRDLADSLRRHQESMIQQEKMVAMGQMAAGVAHEISNPLASMDSVLQLVQRNPQRLTGERIATLGGQIERIKRTVRDLTGFAHPTDYQWQDVPINDLLEQTLGLVRFDRRSKQARIVRQLGAPSISARLQPHAMQQVLTNIMINALDAMADSEDPTLTVSTGLGPQGHPFIAIADNGHGIESRHLGRLFEPFFTTKPVGKGTGLGLAISYNLVRQQGGRIDVTSQPGVGTTFTIHLPPSANESL